MLPARVRRLYVRQSIVAYRRRSLAQHTVVRRNQIQTPIELGID